MATPAFTGVDYLSALSEFPGGPQGLIDAVVERFGDQGLTATPRGDDFSLYVPGEFMSSGRPMNYASALVNPTGGGGYYDYLYSTPAFKDIYTNILSPTLTGLQPQAVAPVESVELQTRPIAKAGGGLVGGATGSTADTQLPGLQVTPPVGQTVTETPKKQLELPQITESVSGLQGTPVETIATPTAPTPIDTRTPEEIQMDKGLDIYNKLFGSDLTGKTYFERPTYPERDPYATEAVDTRPLGIYRTGEPIRGLTLDMPLESRYPESTGQQYLRGGLDAFAFSGPQGYADVRQQLLGEPADAFTGPEVDWQNLGKPAPVRDIYLGTEFPDISVDDILANIPKIDLSDYDAAKDRRLREFIADVPEGAFWQNPDPWEFSDETMSDGLRGAIADLVSDRATEAGDTVFVEAREGIEGTEDPFDYVRDDVSVLEQWLGIRFTDTEKQAMTGAGDEKDFRFYEHPGVRKKFSDGLDTLSEAADLVRKGLFGETPYGPEEQNKQPLDRVTARVRSLGNTIAELNSEVSTLIELEGDTRKSIGTYDPKFPTLKGLLQLATGQGLSEVDKQKYGSLNVGALATLATIAATAPQATAAVLGLQITNTLRKIAPQILNVATFREADYSGNLFSDVVEFSGEVMRPIGRFFVENIFQKINENAPDDANLRSQFESLFEGDKPQTFAEYLEPEATVVVNRPDFPSVDPTGQITPPGTGVPFSEAPASRQNVTGQVTSRPGTEAPIESAFGESVSIAPITTTPSRTTVTGSGTGVGGGIGGSRPTAPIETRDAITLDIAPPVAESPFTGVGVGAGLAPGVASDLPPREPFTDAFGRDIATLDTPFRFVPDTATRPSPFTGMSVSAGELERPLSTLPGVEQIPVDSDRIPIVDDIQIDVPPAGNLVETTVPLDKNGNIVLDGDVSKVAGFGKGTVNLDDIREVFGERAATAIAAGEESSQYGNPFGKLREQWDVQQADKLAGELAKEVRSNLTDILGEGKTKAIYDKWVGEDLSGLGGGYFENVTNASPIDTALATILLEQGEINGTTQAERLQNFANKMNLSISNLAFSGVQLDDIGNLDPARLSFPASTWEMLTSNPSQSSIMSLGEIRPEDAINNIQNIQTSLANIAPADQQITGFEHMSPEFIGNLLDSAIAEGNTEQIETLQNILDLSKQKFPTPERLSDEFGNPLDLNTGLPLYMLDWGGLDSGVTLDITPIIGPAPGP